MGRGYDFSVEMPNSEGGATITASPRDNNRSDRNYGRDGFSGSKSSSQQSNKSDINSSPSYHRNEKNKEINTGKVISSVIGIGVSATQIAILLETGGVIGAVSVGATVSIIGSAFAIPALMLGTVSLVMALNGEKDDSKFDGLELATNPAMLTTLVGSTLFGNDSKKAMQHSKYASTYSKVKDASGLPKDIDKQYKFLKNILEKADAIDSIKGTKEDLEKVRMSKLP